MSFLTPEIIYQTWPPWRRGHAEMIYVRSPHWRDDTILDWVPAGCVSVKQSMTIYRSVPYDEFWIGTTRTVIDLMLAGF